MTFNRLKHYSGKGRWAISNFASPPNSDKGAEYELSFKADELLIRRYAPECELPATG